MMYFSHAEVQKLIAKGITLERDCQAILKGDYISLHAKFSKRFYRVFGETGPQLLYDLEQEKNWDSNAFIHDLNDKSIKDFVFYY